MTTVDDFQELARAGTKARTDQSKARGSVAWRNRLIVDKLDSGMSQAEICRAVKLTREQVRRIVEAERERRAADATDAQTDPQSAR